MKNIERRIRNDRDRDLRQARARELRRLQIVAVVLALIVKCI
jgi:hypothetical protein